MKKIFTYIATLAALLTVSCNNVEINEMPAGDGTFTISLCSADLQTRAEEKQTAQEKAIDHFDWFFFKDAEGTQLLKHGRQTGYSKMFQTADGQEFAALSGTSYFYAIANYPETITATDGTTKLSDLLNLPVKVGIASHPATPFVMDSYDKDKNSVLVKLSPVENNEVRTQTVWMRRVAAKFVVNINVAPSVTVGTGADAHIWKPTTTTQDFYMYMVNSFVDAEGTTLTGTPTDIANVSEATKFYTYNHKHADLTKTDDLHWISASYYSYPVKFATTNQKMPYFKVQMPWVHVKDADLAAEGSNIGEMGTHVFYYKVLFPEITEITRNTLYTLNLTLDKVGGTQEDYIVTTTDLKVTNWLTPSGEFTGYYSARFLDCARDVYEFYGTDNMEIPVTSSHPIEARVLSAKKYDFKNKGIEVNVNTTTSPYSITNNGKNSFTLTHALDNVMSRETFDCSPITFTVEIRHEDNGQPHVETVTVIQYPPIYIQQETSNGRVFVNGQGGSNTNRTTVYNSGNPQASIGTIASRNGINDSGDNTNPRQYTVYVSVLPSSSSSVIGDPRGAKGGISNLGTTVSQNYRPTASNKQNVIAPAFKMASSYGKTVDIIYERAEERCAAYQENGYPAGRWRVPTVAEIEFVVSLSEYNHIPPLYKTGRADDWSNNYKIYDSYWAAGKYAYAGVAYNSDSNRGTYESLSNLNPWDGVIYRKNVGTYYNNYYYFTNAVRCVYDVWYWGEEQDTDHLTSWSGYQVD